MPTDLYRFLVFMNCSIHIVRMFVFSCWPSLHDARPSCHFSRHSEVSDQRTFSSGLDSSV
jgi:hypothetical protein